jgi:PAS domain-containing protein
MEISLSRCVESRGDCAKQRVEVDEIDVLIIGINTHGRIEIWNQLAASATGFPAEIAYGRDLYSSLTSNNKFNFKYNLKHLRQIVDNSMHGERLTDQSSFLLFSGNKIAMSLKPVLWHKNPGGLHGIILIGQDASGIRGITDYTDTQELLDFISCTDLPLLGVDSQSANSPDINGRTKIYISFPTKKSTTTATSERLVGEKDPGKEISNPVHVHDMCEDIQTFTNCLDALIFGVDSFGKVNLWNDKSVHVFGCSREEAIGKNFVQVANL